MAQRIVIDLFDRAEELDVVGPWEVLSYWTQKFPEDGWTVDMMSDDGQPRTCAKGLLLGATAARADCGTPAVVVEPGGIGSRTRLADEEHLEWLRAAHRSGAIMTSVCTGALVYAAAGLLTNRPATTHHAAFPELTAQDPTVRHQPSSRWVDDGDVITAAGVSAGIDMALHLVGRLASPERAAEVQKGIEYYPAPPIAAS